MTRREKVLNMVQDYINFMITHQGGAPSQIAITKKQYQVLVDADMADQKKAGIGERKRKIHPVTELFNLPVIVVG